MGEYVDSYFAQGRKCAKWEYDCPLGTETLLFMFYCRCCPESKKLVAHMDHNHSDGKFRACLCIIDNLNNRESMKRCVGDMKCQVDHPDTDTNSS